MPDFRHPHLDGGPDRLAPNLGAFIFFRPVVQHFLHAMLCRIAGVQAEQIVRFTCRFAVLCWPRIVDLLN